MSRDFNGTTHRGYIVSPQTSSFISTSLGTICGWVRARSVQSNSNVYGIPVMVRNSNGHIGIAMGDWTGGSGDRIYYYNHDGAYDIITGAAYSLNTWYHLTWVHSGGTLYAYRNGVSEGTVASGNTTSLATETQLANGSTKYLNGFIAHVGIWNVALTGDEIRALAAGASPSHIRRLSLTGHWPIWAETSLSDQNLTGRAKFSYVGPPGKGATDPPVIPLYPGWGSVVESSEAAVRAGSYHRRRRAG